MKEMFRPVSLVLLAVFFACSSCMFFPKSVRVGSKNTLEQTLLGEIIAQHLEKRTSFKVVRRLAFGNATVLNQAAFGKEIDVFPEDTATAIAVLVNEASVMDPVALRERVRTEYERMFGLAVSQPLGPSVRARLVVKKELAQKEGLTDISTAAASKVRWRFGITEDFSGRRDGMPLLNASYKFSHLAAAPTNFEAGALYPTLRDGHADIITGTESDALATDPDFQPLIDDKKIFPPAQICIVSRMDALKNVPGLKEAIDQLIGKMSTEQLRAMNKSALIDKKPLADVAREFLSQAGLR